MRCPRGVFTWQERLAMRSAPREDGCWIWTGPLDRNGYGRFSGTWGIERATTSGAHRWSYIARHGSIPKGMHLDHLCNNPSCVNPDHLEPVTPGENMRRAHARRKLVAEPACEVAA